MLLTNNVPENVHARHDTDEQDLVITLRMNRDRFSLKRGVKLPDIEVPPLQQQTRTRQSIPTCL